ncbi:MAG: HAD family hydrolase [Armatimonadota bacterium]
MSDPAQPLKQLKKDKKFLVGIDSDGCAFDTMEIKHKECFIPNVIKYWDLQAVSKYAREAGEFVNLYSKWRGINRWPALLMVFDLLGERPEVAKRGVKPPSAEALRKWVAEETKLSNNTLETLIQTNPDPILQKALAWSEAVNDEIADMVHDVPPFPFMRESLEKMSATADAIVVSQTPTEALEREWREHSIDSYVKVIAGQEMGSKSEHLKFAMDGRWDSEHVIMIGDAPGDFKAAKANGCFFYPINPGHEEDSWQRFYDEAYDKFTNGTYGGGYQEKLIAEFDKYLPEHPPWKCKA